jgi:hypothetical protein
MEGLEMEAVPMSLRLAGRALLIGFTYAVQAGGFSNMEHARNAALVHSMATRCEAACLDQGLTSPLN